MNQVSPRQLSIMIFFIPLVFKMATLPALLYEEVYATGYVVMAIITTMEFIQLALVLFVCYSGGMEGIKEKFGINAYRIISLPMLFVFGVKIILFLHEISTYVTSYLFYNSSEIGSISLILIVAVYLGIKGARAVGRLFEVVVWIAPIIIVLGILYGKLDFQSIYITPIFNESASKYVGCIGKYLIYTFDFSPLLFIKADVKKGGQIAFCAVISTVIVSGCCLLLYGVYGNASMFVHSAFSRLASFNSAVSETGSLDWPSGLLWITTGILNIALKFNAVDRISRSMNFGKVGSIVYAIVIGVLLFVFLPTFDKTLAFCTSGVQYVVCGIEIGLPLALLLLYALKNKRGVKLCLEKSNG